MYYFFKYKKIFVVDLKKKKMKEIKYIHKRKKELFT